MFTAVEIAEAALLRDFPFYNLNGQFANASNNLSISVDYLMRNSLSNSGCSGGNYYLFLCDFNNYFQTFETAAHFPYTDQFKASEIRITPPVLKNEQYFKPYAYQKTIELKDGRLVNYSCNTNIIAIKVYNGYPFDKTAELRIKYMLAKGIAIEGAMQASASAKF